MAKHDFDLFVPLGIVEPDDVAAARLEHPDIVLAVGIRNRRLVLAVPQPAQDAGPLDQALIKSHQHLIADLGQQQ